VQLLKRCPLNLRHLLRVKKGFNPKGMGLFLSSYLRKYQISGKQEYLDRGFYFSKWLEDNVSKGYSGACWGYNFDWPNRGFYAPAGTPTIVNTAFIGLSFLDLQKTISDSIDSAWTLDPLAVARSCCTFILEDLNIFHASIREICFSYTPHDTHMVHNANLLGARLLAEVYEEVRDKSLFEYALAAARFTAHRQRKDGSWPYGEVGNQNWVDNFHTGYVLVALKRISTCLETEEFQDVINRGYDYWKRNLFCADGTPKYYPNRKYPIDIHSVAQAILTFMEFSDIDPEAEELMVRSIIWGIRNMQDHKGYFHYQISPYFRTRIPYIRWSQAWMQRALSEYQYKEEMKRKSLKKFQPKVEIGFRDADLD
jgi:hypothetical protein